VPAIPGKQILLQSKTNPDLTMVPTEHGVFFVHGSDDSKCIDGIVPDT
jgi:hypothetical protein